MKEEKYKVEQDEKKFYMLVDGYECVITYRMFDNRIMELPHTYVPPEIRGKGLAQIIIRHALEYAKQNDYQVIPSCWAVSTFIKRNPDYQHLLAKP